MEITVDTQDLAFGIKEILKFRNVQFLTYTRKTFIKFIGTDIQIRCSAHEYGDILVSRTSLEGLLTIVEHCKQQSITISFEDNYDIVIKQMVA
jgi:hypothetical protein